MISCGKRWELWGAREAYGFYGNKKQEGRARGGLHLPVPRVRTEQDVRTATYPLHWDLMATATTTTRMRPT